MTRPAREAASAGEVAAAREVAAVREAAPAREAALTGTASARETARAREASARKAALAREEGPATSQPGASQPGASQPGASQPGASQPSPASPRRQLALLVLDIGAPIGLYYGLRGVGFSNLVALGTGAIVPAVGVIVQLVTRRRLDGVGGVVVVSVLATIAGSLITDSPRFLLARDGFITALWGLWFLATLRGRWALRPAAFALARPLMEGRRSLGLASWEALWAGEPRFRRIWQVSTIIWGVGMLADAALRVLMSYTLPISVVPGLAGALWPVTFVLIQVVTNVYYNRAGLYRLLGAPWVNQLAARRGGARLSG